MNERMQTTMTLTTSGVIFMTGATVGWAVRAFMAALPTKLAVPFWAQIIEKQALMLMLSLYARYTSWQLAKQFKDTATKHIFGQSNKPFDNEDPTKPWAMNAYLQLLPWTAKYHQSTGAIVEGKCATRALIDILWDMGKDHNGFVSVDYQVDGEPHTTYRLALTKDVTFNGAENSWPFRHSDDDDDDDSDDADDDDGDDGDVRMGGTEDPKRPAVIRAVFIANPGGLLGNSFDVTQFFVALDGPQNTFSDMKDIPISRLLLETVVPNDDIEGGIIKLATVRGTVVLPVDTLMRDAHRRLCVVGAETIE